MKVKLAITDLTRMYRGKVCIAGYDKDHHGMRPVLPPPGISESSLVQDDQPVIFPFSLVEFDLLKPDPQLPHTEDSLFDPASPRFVQRVKNGIYTSPDYLEGRTFADFKRTGNVIREMEDESQGYEVPI